jgi:glycosyltransferase involved in cell wall biosynthesis
LGTLQDVRPAIHAADCVVLPSYREGLPRSLMEASAMGKPVIATDVPGCRDVVEDGVTGLLCAPQSDVDLAAKMTTFLQMSAQTRAQMGTNGRAFVRREFDEKIVFAHYLESFRRLGLQPTTPTPLHPELTRLMARNGAPTMPARETGATKTGPGVEKDAPASVF